MTDEQTLKQWSSPQRIRPRLTAHRTWMGRGNSKKAHWELRLADKQTGSQTDQLSVVGLSLRLNAKTEGQTDRSVLT